MPWVYILRCATGDLYVGMTSDVQRRLEHHNDGSACTFTRHRRPVELAYSEFQPSNLAAGLRERQIKRWTRAKKEALVAGNHEDLRTLSRRSGA
jgi:predicted GIY-YIG superfamily endonuclease